ncbi:MAG TPA: hypothetical protein VJ724_01965 [Tahibacter sp.]|nr:hypothetical protein [Tahibacter sp.]
MTAIRWMAVLGLFAAMPLAAADDDAKAAFERADFNNDGKISFEEYRNRSVRVFHDLDQNGDGRLTGDEQPPAKDAKGQPSTGGTVSVESFTDALADHFERADANRDGSLDVDEWANVKAGKKPARK